MYRAYSAYWMCILYCSPTRIIMKKPTTITNAIIVMMLFMGPKTNRRSFSPLAGRGARHHYSKRSNG